MPIVLGVDPGSKHTGYGVVAKKARGLTLVAAGRISPPARDSLADRLRFVYEGLSEVVFQHAPDLVSVEDIFFAKNVRSAVRLGHVRGVVLLAAATAGLPVYEYTPASIKMALVGYGRAEKSQVNLMVKQVLGITQDLADDASDALAAAVCHLNQNPALKGMRG